MLRFFAIFAWAVVAGAADGPSAAAPRVGLAAKGWQLDFEFHDPTRITLTLPGRSEPTTFWYLLYTVTNNTGREVEFYPTFHLVTDTLEVVEGGDHIHPKVYDDIRARHRKQYPFLVVPPGTHGVLNQGSDNRRASVAVFRDFDPQASAFAVYVGGLSSEMVRVNNPTHDPSKAEAEGNSRFFVLRKTLGIHYDLPGDSRTRSTTIPARVKREWVMR
jgi:hypothetical protein